MATNKPKLSPYILQMKLYDSGSETHVGQLLMKWIDAPEDSGKLSTWADTLKKALSDYKPDPGLGFTSRENFWKGRERDYLKESTHRVITFRGHYLTDPNAIETIAALFPNIPDAVDKLTAAHKQDVTLWKNSLRTRILTTNDPAVFINALAVYYGIDQGGHMNFADIREDYYLEKKLEDQGVEYQPFVFRWSNVKDVSLEPEFRDWLLAKYPIAQDPEIMTRFNNVVKIQEMAEDGTMPPMTIAEVRIAEKAIDRFSKMVSYGFEKSGLTALELFNLTVNKKLQIDPKLVPINVPAQAAKALGGKFQWPDVEQFELMREKFQAASDAHPRDKWFDSTYFTPGDKSNPASGIPFSEGFEALYAEASTARDKLMATGYEGKSGGGQAKGGTKNDPKPDKKS